MTIFDGAREDWQAEPRAWPAWISDGFGIVLVMANGIVWPLLLWAVIP